MADPLVQTRCWKEVPPQDRIAFSDLTAEVQQRILEHLRQEACELAAHPKVAVERYRSLPESMDGLLVNGDVLNLLLATVRSNPGPGFTALERVESDVLLMLMRIHKVLRDQALDRARAASLPVLVTVGGQGSGKTTLACEMLRRGLVGAALDAPHSEPQDLAKSVAAILECHLDAVVVFVDRALEDAVRAMLYRTYEEGRYVRLGRMVKAHRGAPEAVLQTLGRGPGGPRVWLAHVQNDPGFAEGKVSGGLLPGPGVEALASMRKRPYRSEWELHQVALKTGMEAVEHDPNGSFEPAPADVVRELERDLPGAGRGPSRAARP